jgi:catechol 2,3-dioxygenase-like lactoylglutathione lyase family enzyme
MAIILDHTIVPAADKVASAKFFAELFGLAYDGLFGPFAPVRINDSLTMDFDDRWKEFGIHHYAFHVSEADFDAIFGRVKVRGLTYGSGPMAQGDMRVGEFNGGRTVYFHELNGHLLEIRNKTSAEDIAAMRQSVGHTAR